MAAAKVPALQTVHSAAPAAEYLPATQLVQVDALAAAKVPALHIEHCSDFVVLENLPAAQGSQVLDNCL